MSNKQTKPAAGKSVAGKNNLKNKNSKKAPSSTVKKNSKKKTKAEKSAQKLKDTKQKELIKKQKKSAAIKKQREKAKREAEKREQKAEKALANQRKIKERKRKLKKIKKKIKKIFSKKFWASLNYGRILLFIVLPIATIVVCCVLLFKSVSFNVPSDIRSLEFNGRIETTANESIYNSQQQQVFTESLQSVGSGKFSFYMNSETHVDDDFVTKDMSLGNPSSNKCCIVAVIYDDDGNIIYRSLGIEPGKEINTAKLFKDISYGTHELKVAVNAYNSETYKKIGTRYAEIELAVGE